MCLCCYLADAIGMAENDLKVAIEKVEHLKKHLACLKDLERGIIHEPR